MGKTCRLDHKLMYGHRQTAQASHSWPWIHILVVHCILHQCIHPNHEHVFYIVLLWYMLHMHPQFGTATALGQASDWASFSPSAWLTWVSSMSWKTSINDAMFSLRFSICFNVAISSVNRVPSDPIGTLTSH